MINYSFKCNACGSEFSSYFKNNETYEKLKSAKAVTCNSCTSNDLVKLLSSPSVVDKSETNKKIDQAEKQGIDLIKYMKDNFDNVGEKFADEMRAMHYGDSENRSIVGTVTDDEVKSLVDEGIEDFLMFDEKKPN